MGGGQKRGSHTQEEDRREATHRSGAHTPRGKDRVRQLTDSPAQLHSSNFKPAPIKQQQQRHKASTGPERKKVFLCGFPWTFHQKLCLFFPFILFKKFSTFVIFHQPTCTGQGKWLWTQEELILI